MNVRVFLDVDGVINAIEPDDSWDDWQTGKAGGFRIHWSPTVVKQLCDLVMADGVEVLWLTTWGALANRHLCPLVGMPDLAVAGETPPDEQEWWKFTVVKDIWQRDPIPFVWIDDDLGFNDDGASQWIKQLNQDGHRALGLRPDSRKGLTARLLGELWAFVQDSG